MEWPYTLTWCRLIPISNWKAWKDPGNKTKLDTQDSEFNATSKALVDMVLIKITLAKFPFWWVIAQEQVYTTEYTRKSGEDYVKTIGVQLYEMYMSKFTVYFIYKANSKKGVQNTEV